MEIMLFVSHGFDQELWRSPILILHTEKLLSQLSGSEWESFVEVIKPHVIALKKASTRQNSAIDKLMNSLATPPPSSGPASPVLQVDAGSAIPTPPSLTMGHNSPSSSPPSTNDGAVEETGGAPLDQTNNKLAAT